MGFTWVTLKTNRKLQQLNYIGHMLHRKLKEH